MTTTWICPNMPFGHDWNNGLTCRWCDATRTTSEAIVSGLASRRSGDEESARRLLNAHRTGVTTEALRNAAQSLAHIHSACKQGRDACSGCQVRADMLDVLTSTADVLADSNNPTQTAAGAAR